MKQFFVMTAIIIFCSVSLQAKTVFVSSLKAKVYKNAKFGSSVVSSAKRGSRLSVITTKGQWYQVKFRGKKGWVQKMFVKNRKPGKKVSLLGSASKKARMHARKRASSDVTAASARGLLADKSGRSRMNENRRYDPADLHAMEKRYVSEEELISFLGEIGIKK